MPDLPDDLRALLHERAEHAPPAPAPTEAYVRRVARRRTAKVAGTAATGALAMTAVGALVLAAPREAALQPATPPAPPTAVTTAAQTVTAETGDDRPCLDLRPLSETDSSPEWDRRQDAPPIGADDHGFTFDVDPDRPAFGQDVYRAGAGATCTLLVEAGSVQHDLRLHETTGKRRTVWRFKTVKTGGVFLWDDRHPLTQDRYQLTCAIHPAMRASVVVS
jgi:hypothetical protein